MSMLSAFEESESQHSCSADGIGRNHALDRQLHRLGGTGSHQGAVLGLLEVTDITGMTIPFLLFELLAGKDGVLTVDDDNVIAAIYMGREGDLLLASEQDRSLQIPLLVNCVSVDSYKIGIIVSTNYA